MLIRVDAYRYSTMVERDGLQLRVPGYAFIRDAGTLDELEVGDAIRLEWASVRSGKHHH
jgi:hypothetical protein